MTLTETDIGRTLVVCGKGGVGKTTVSALITRHLATRPDRRALVVDADHAGGLTVALGLNPASTLNDIRLAALAERKAQTTSRKHDLSQSLDYRLLAALAERQNIAFLALGRPDEAGCFCPVNTLLKRSIEVLASQFDVTLVDAEAGVEQINRDVVGAIGALLLVADTSVKALRVAEAVSRVAGRLQDARGNTPPMGLLINRVRAPAEVDAIGAQTKLPLLGWIPEDPMVREFDAQAKSFFDLPPCPGATAVDAALATSPLLRHWLA